MPFYVIQTLNGDFGWLCSVIVVLPEYEYVYF